MRRRRRNWGRYCFARITRCCMRGSWDYCGGYSGKTRFVELQSVLMTIATEKQPYELIDFASLPGTPCPCGTARRAFTDVEDFPGTIHVTEIALDNTLHYHKRLT